MVYFLMYTVYCTTLDKISQTGNGTAVYDLV